MRKHIRLGTAVAAAALIAACGGGGGDSGPVTPTSYTFSGTVATGAAFTGATVTVIDATGQSVGTSSTVGADGKYTIPVAATAKAPFVIVATRTAASGETETLVSVTNGLSSQTINVTPVTTLIAARLSPTGNPAKLAAELASGSATLTSDKIQEKVAEIQTLLAPLLDAANVKTVNPLTSAFNADGAGYDRLLDSLLVSITPATSTTTNIEVAVRQASGSGDPVSVQFNSGTTTPEPLPTGTYTLVEEGTAAKIATLLQEMTACYALPIDQRVSSAVTNGVAIGDASAVTAAACRAIFTGNAPSAFLNNGVRVGRDAGNNGAFAGLFRTVSTGVKFQQGRYEYATASGDLVISYKTVDTQQNESYDTVVVHKDTDGKLRAIGNQYRYSGSVTPNHQLRLFPTLQQSENDYYSTGYVLSINNETEVVNGQPLLKFDRVVVQTPFGNELTLWANANYSVLNFKRADGRISGTNFVRLGSAFVGDKTGSPADGIEPSLYFAKPQFTEAELTNYATLSIWTFKYFLRGNSTDTPDSTQTYRARARALTLGELKQRSFVTLTSDFAQEAFSDGDDLPSQDGPLAGTLPMYSKDDGPQPALIDYNGGDAWTVPEKAIAPTIVSVNGIYALSNTISFSFDDAVRVPSTARKASVPCSPPVTGGNGQCTDRTSGNYAEGSYLTGLQFSGTAMDGRQFATHYSTYRLTAPK